MGRRCEGPREELEHAVATDAFPAIARWVRAWVLGTSCHESRFSVCHVSCVAHNYREGTVSRALEWREIEPIHPIRSSSVWEPNTLII